MPRSNKAATGAHLNERWDELCTAMAQMLGARPGVEGLLFLIGLHARGAGYEPDLPKEEKQALIMDGAYRALATVGVYEKKRAKAGQDVVWERCEAMGDLTFDEDEDLLREGIITYFDAALPGETGEQVDGPAI